MNPDTGEIAALDKIAEEMLEGYSVPVDESSLSPDRQRELEETGRTKIGRNDPCACGSGKKFKKCCLR